MSDTNEPSSLPGAAAGPEKRHMPLAGIVARAVIGFALCLMAAGYIRGFVEARMTGSGSDGGMIFIGLMLLLVLLPVSVVGFILDKRAGQRATSFWRQFVLESRVLFSVAWFFAIAAAMMLMGAVAGASAATGLIQMFYYRGVPGDGMGQIGLAEGGALFGAFVGLVGFLWWKLRILRKQPTPEVKPDKVEPGGPADLR